MAGPVDPRLLRRARATRSYLVAGVGVGIATAMLVIGQAWLLSRLVVGTFSTRTLPPTPLVAALAAVFLARAGLAWLNQLLAHRAAAAVKSQLRSDVVAARGSAPVATASAAETVTLLTQGLDALDGYFAKFLPQLALAATVPFLVGAVILWQDWLSAVILLVTLPLIPVFMALIGWTTQVRVERRWAVQQRLARHFADLIAGLPTLQAFGRARAQEKGLALTEDANRRETNATLRISFLSSFALELLATLSVALVAVGVGLRVLSGALDYQTALFVLVLAPEAYLPVRLVGVHYHDSADGQAAANQALAIIEAADDAAGTPHPGATVPDLARATIRLDDLGHTYPGASGPALSGLTATIAPGRVVALSGPSGGGKSTALHALMGFLRPSAGRVSVDGLDVVTLDPTAWRRQLAWVGQHPGMVTGTIADNVRLGHPGASDAQVRDALARAGGASLEPERPVGDEGEGLSAGERRRVAIARALLRIDHGARLLVLDEPTAGLDEEAEAAVLRAVRASGAGALVVSHRPQVLAAADDVVTVAPPVAEVTR